MANSLKCGDCGYEAKDQMDLEKHQEQKHGAQTNQRQSQRMEEEE